MHPEPQCKSGHCIVSLIASHFHKCVIPAQKIIDADMNNLWKIEIQCKVQCHTKAAYRDKDYFLQVESKRSPHNTKRSSGLDTTPTKMSELFLSKLPEERQKIPEAFT
jgi:hypothetical protein